MRNFEISLKPVFEEKVLFQNRNETTKKRLFIDFCFPFLCYHRQGCSQSKCNNFLSLHFYLHFSTLSTIIIAIIVTFFLIIKQYM